MTQRDDELNEIRDGAWGDNPAVRGAARNKLEIGIPYSWCQKDDCVCYWPECREHGCMEAKGTEL